MPVTTEEIWRGFRSRLLGFIRRRVARTEDAEDILQDVFIRIHGGIASVRDEERLLPWIFQVARNALTDFYRSSARRREPVPEDGIAGGAEADGADEQSALAELAGCLKPLMERLPGPYREALTAVELEGRTHQDAADGLGISLSGMKSRVQRGRERVRALLHDCCHLQMGADKAVMGYAVKESAACPCAPRPNPRGDASRGQGGPEASRC